MNGADPLPLDVVDIDRLARAIQEVEGRLREHVLVTPLEPSPALSARTGASVTLKLENTQRTGSFKLRGALSKLLSLSPDERSRGVVTASSGNHGMAVAFGARSLGSHAEVYVPTVASRAKLDRIRALGAELRIEGDDGLQSETTARRVAEESGRTYVSPYNDLAVVAGQGTVGTEITRAWTERRVPTEEPPLDAVFVALGGGGLVSGIACALKARWPEIEVVACSPANSAVMAESVRAGRILDLPSEPTLSDGTAGGVEEGAVTFGLCQRLVDRYAEVDEEQIASAMRHVIEVEHTLVEGAAAVPVAAFLEQSERYEGRRVCIVLCGANVSLETLRAVLSV